MKSIALFLLMGISVSAYGEKAENIVFRLAEELIVHITKENPAAGYGVIALTMGKHQIELKEAGESSQLYYSGPTLKKTIIIP